MLLHVMAGDKVEMNVNNFYERYEAENDQPINPEDMLGSLISTLTGAQGGYTGIEEHEAKTVTDALTLENYAQFNDILNTTTDPNHPKAYLNYILFDEAFNIVPEMSGSFQANGAGSWTPIGTSVPLEVPASGYLAVYLSNSSTNASVDEYGNVYFDQLVIRFSRGRLKEEAHYYPHGLPIHSMGSVAIGMTENKDKYQANAYNKELGLNWMDFNHRQYDPQIGRFLSVDPLADQTHTMSPYVAMNNNAASLTDPDGLRVGDELTNAWSGRMPTYSPIPEGLDGEMRAIMEHLYGQRTGGEDWEEGLSGSVETFYGDEARQLFAALTGQTLHAGHVGGNGDGDEDKKEESQSGVTGLLKYTPHYKVYNAIFGDGSTWDAVSSVVPAAGIVVKSWTAPYRIIKSASDGNYGDAAGAYAEHVITGLSLMTGGVLGAAERSWSGFGRNISGNLKFRFMLRWPKNNFMIRIERAHRSPMSNTKVPYFGKLFNGYNTHINIQKFGVFNYHFLLNPLKWKYYVRP